MSSSHHHRHSSAFSTSSAFHRSRTPSPCPVPASEIAGLTSPIDAHSPITPSEGLSRRLSWNSVREEGSPALGGGGMEHEAVVGGGLNRSWSGLGFESSSEMRPRGSISEDEMEHDIGMIPTGSSNIFSSPNYPYPSEISLASQSDHSAGDRDRDGDGERRGSSQSDLSATAGRKGSIPRARNIDDEEEEEEAQWLSPNPTNLDYRPRLNDARAGPSRPRNRNKPYGTSSTGLSAVNALGRSATFRNVSRTIRKASVRVVNIMGDHQDAHHDMTRLSDDEGEGGSPTHSPGLHRKEADGDGVELRSFEGINGMSKSPDRERPDPRPPETGRLRGRTFGLFGPTSGIRRGLDSMMRNPFTEPIILLLIITNVVVLIIQASHPLNVPRSDAGYFHSWEDAVLLALFTIFTIEMLARMVVTGLILDPEISLHQVLFAPNGAIPAMSRRLNRAQSTLQRSTSGRTPRRAMWRERMSTIDMTTNSHPAFVAEAPFQHAMAHQKALSTAGRPYLRHSWHRIDLLAITSFWITFILSITGQESTASHHIYIFRALSVLRAGRLLVITSGTTTILHSLKRAGPLLITVAYFVVFAAILFSIIGVQSFRGSLRRVCVLTDPNNASNTITLGQQCGGFLDAISLDNVNYLRQDGLSSRIDAKGFICPLNQICQVQDQNPEGNSQSFDNIFASLVQVIIIASINTWSGVMYTTMDSDFFSSSLYFLVGVVVINFWLINLVIAVVVNTFKDIRANTKRSAFGADQKAPNKANPWANERREGKNRVLALYDRIQLFWVALVLADLVAQACKTASSSQGTLDLLKNLELAFTFAFDFEMAMRVVGYFPDWRGFLGSGRNFFDLLLAVVCSIIQLPVIASTEVYSWLTVFQLMRWYRVILAFPRMKPLLITVFGSFAGLLNLIIFLLLVNLIGALVAVQLFRGDIPSGDTIDFGQTYNSFLGMYQIFSSENWTDVLYSAMSNEFEWKQGWLAAIFLCAWFLFSYFIVLQLFIAVINENFAVAEEQKRKAQIEAFMRRSEPIHAYVSWIDRLNPYRLFAPQQNAVKVVTLPADLVLPVRQNHGIGLGRPRAANPNAFHSGRTKGAMRRLFGLDSATRNSPLRALSMRRPGRAEVDDDLNDDRGLTDLLPPNTADPSVDEKLNALREQRKQQAEFIAAHPTYDQSLWLFKQSNPIRQFCQSCVPSAYGDRIYGRRENPNLALILRLVVFLAVVASIVVAAVATPLYRKHYYLENGMFRGTWFDLTEVALGMVFVVEAGIKIIADGFVFAPNAYLLSLWNVLDFIVLVTLLVNTTTSLIFIGGLSRVTRALKAFRALRLITLFSRLRDTLHAVLFAGALKILDASILMILYLIPFAVWGLNIFSGLLYSCNDSSSDGKSSCIGEYMSSPVDDSLNFLAPRVWSNPAELGQTAFTFDSFRTSILILFEIVSLEGWIDVMSAGMNIVGMDIQPQKNYSQWNAIFFIIFNLLGAVVILTLFVSIIIENFSTRSGNALLTTEQRQWVDLSKFIRAQTPSRLPKVRPQSALRLWCYNRATHKDGFWARGFTVIYYIHILLLMTEDYSNNVMSDAQRDAVFLSLTMLYAFDLLIRFYGLGFKSFRANGWNIFDLIVITGSFATTIPAFQDALNGQVGSQVNIQLQKLFLVSISLKLVQRIDSLNQLFKTSVASLPAIGNLFLLWATLFIFFSILLMEVFGLTKEGNNATGSRFQNYYSFGNALVMLAFMSTGEGWNGYMHDYTIAPPRCTSSSSYFDSDCGSPSWSFGLFISWNILSMYIFMNMFTGVVVESFAYVYQMPGGPSLNREEMRAFKRVWADLDTGRTGYIRRKDFIRFFSRLSGALDVKIYPKEFSVSNLIRSSIPDPVENASGRLLVAQGVKAVVDVRRLEQHISNLDYRKVRERRLMFTRLYNEARISEVPKRGISFTAMLTMLAHYKLIDDEKALQLDDLLDRRAKTERVTDLVNLDRVRGLLRTIYWRRRFLEYREERRRILNAEGRGIPAIVLQPTPASPPMDNEYSNPFEDHPRDIPPSPSPSPPGSPVRGFGPASPAMSSGHSPDITLGPSFARLSPSLSVSSQHGRSGPPSPIREHFERIVLSSEDGEHHPFGRDPASGGDDVEGLEDVNQGPLNHTTSSSEGGQMQGGGIRRGSQ